MRAAALLATYPAPMRVCDSADFDGTNDYLLFTGTPAGIADGKLGILSCWVRLDGGDGAAQVLITNNNALFSVQRGSDDLFHVFGARVGGGGDALSLATINTYVAGATWLHILASWNMGVAGSGRLYVNDMSDKNEVAFTDEEIDYATTLNWAVGGLIAGSAKVNACLAEFYFAAGQYLDFSLVSNRRKFISASGKPVHLGATGSLPTGTAPQIYFHLDDAEASANFATNRGTGGDFAVTGTLTAGSTSPSD